MTVLMNRPKCRNHEKCGNTAIMIVNRMWLCYPCFEKIRKKMEELQEEILLEE